MVHPSPKNSSEASEANLAENKNKTFSSRVSETERPFKNSLGYPSNPPNPPSPCPHLPNPRFKDSR